MTMARPTDLLTLAALACTLGVAGIGCDAGESAPAESASSAGQSAATEASGETGETGETSKDEPLVMVAVDPSLLGAPVEVAGLSIRPPRHWPGITGAMLDAAAEPYSDDQKLLALHMLPGTGTMFVTEVTPDLAGVYGDRLAEAIPGIQQVTFEINDLSVTQWHFDDGQTRTFKLMVTGPDGIAQVDYIVPTNKWNRESKSVESSIGSIQKPTTATTATASSR